MSRHPRFAHCFLRYKLDSYPCGRGGELREELPLYRVENQSYLYYNKGSLIFYRLRDEIGEERLNRVLARFIKAHAFQNPPHPTSRDLLDILREAAPADNRKRVSL